MSRLGSKRDPTLLARPAQPRLASRVAIARAVIEARVAKGWSQEALARRARTSKRSVSQIEGVQGNPELATVDRVLSALGLQLDVKRRVTESGVRASL